MGFLVKHEHVTKGVFLGIATAIGVFLIPMLMTATAAVFAFIAPFTPLIAAVAGLGAAFGLLYDDYKTWAEGGKSLFDWGKFTSYINGSKVSTDSLGKSFVYLTTGYTSWSEAANGMLDWMRLKGFIDGNTVSVGSLMNGFKNLASELSDGLMPYLMDIVNIFDRLKEGDFSGAGEAVKVAVKRRWEAAKAIGGAVWDRMTGAVDVATGHEVGTIGNKARKVEYGSGGKLKGGVLNLTQRDVDDILRVTATEAVGSLKGKAFTDQVGGIVDTVLNRGSMHKGGIRGAINQKWAFSDINAPRKSAYGAVQNVPWKRVSPKLREAVMNHLKARASGKESTVGGNTHYANPYYLGEASKATKKWVREAQEQAKVTGQIYGAGRAIHVHGTPTGERRASRFGISLPDYGLLNKPLGGQAVAGNLQSQQTQIRAANSAAKPHQVSNQNSTQVTVNGGIHVKTTADTVRGNAEDAAAGMFDRVSQYAVAQG